MLTVLILTKDEEHHIARAIQSVKNFSDRIVVVDSGSTDRTVEIATELGAKIFYREWTNQSKQFNWALEQLPDDTQWVFRLDADEIVSSALADQITNFLSSPDNGIVGVTVNRRIAFMGKSIRFGGLFPIQVLRLFRFGHGHCENRWMDEHIKVDGDVLELSGELLDDNINSLSWWTAKHNSYASREVVDLLNLEIGFAPVDTVAKLGFSQTGSKRWLKEKLYAKMPIGLRAFLYFLYRFIIRFGFMDGKEGVAFHVLQGFWYRYLVDLKLYEVKKFMKNNNCDHKKAISIVLGINI
jgi:glycosyltransferase involved in cell wall biosynthesis